jgi:hypothetical protein
MKKAVQKAARLIEHIAERDGMIRPVGSGLGSATFLEEAEEHQGSTAQRQSRRFRNGGAFFKELLLVRLQLAAIWCIGRTRVYDGKRRIN